MSSEMLDKITYSFLELNSFTVEMWEWMSNAIPLFIMAIITVKYLI